MLPWGLNNRVMTDKCELTAKHGFSYVCDEFKHSVNKLGLFDDAKWIVA
jgi:hypothetical protein